ncbi:MAG: hypothetical protein H6719_04490 [Sandaracinaceae bacterium]|nr:hypothetical protein [Sandaracinaceae bacterium]
MARGILAEHRPTLVRDVRDGATVKVVGHVRKAERALRSPLTGRVGVYYDVLVTGAGIRRIREQEAVDFYVEDETGRALVLTEDLQVAVVRDLDEKIGWLPDAGLRAFLAAHGAVRGYERAKEGTLELDERIAVVGRASWVPDDGANLPVGYRERPQILLLGAPSDQPLVVSDDPSTFR